MTGSRTDYSGPGGTSSRWSTPTAPGKTVEVQRTQVDELFKNLRGGEELEETEPRAHIFRTVYCISDHVCLSAYPAPEIGTLLYPHQKKALTFLLEREQEIDRGDHRSTLWQCIPNPITGQKSWCHLVTQKELYEVPHESRGAILADDVSVTLAARRFKPLTCAVHVQRWVWARQLLLFLLLLQLSRPQRLLRPCR